MKDLKRSGRWRVVVTERSDGNMSELYDRDFAANRERSFAAIGWTVRDSVVLSPAQATRPEVRVVGTSPDIVLDNFGRRLADGCLLLAGDQAWCMCLTADCPVVTVFGSDEDWALCVHAGRPGLEKDVIANAFESLPQDLSQPAAAFVGPFISTANYPIPEEFGRAHGWSTLHGSGPGAEMHIDLRRRIERDLIRIGLTPSRLIWDGRDTYSSPDLFSRRRDLAGGLEGDGCHAVGVGLHVAA